MTTPDPWRSAPSVALLRASGTATVDTLTIAPKSFSVSILSADSVDSITAGGFAAALAAGRLSAAAAGTASRIATTPQRNARAPVWRRAVSGAAASMGLPLGLLGRGLAAPVRA